MKKLTILTVLVLILALLAGCAGGNNPTEAPTDAPTEPATEATTEPDNLFTFTRENFPRMDGSTSMVPLGEAIASVLLSESRDAVSDLVQFNRTTQSFRNLMADFCDILIVGEPNAAVYDEMEEQGFQADIETIATDALVFVVNADNPVDNLTTEQVRKIYSGEITNWSEVGGNDAEIVLIGREAGSGTRDGFESITKTTDKCQYRQELTSTGDVITTVSQNPDAIGYASLSSVKDSVKALTVGGVAPTEDTVKDGSYVIQRPFVLVTKDGTKLSEAAQKFFDYALSADAAPIIAAAGAVAAN